MITDITLRLTGLVSFSDQTLQKYLAIYEDAAYVDPMSAESIEAFKQLWLEKNVTIRALLNSLGGNHTITTGAPTSNLVVTDWTMDFSGTIARSDGTHGHFGATYDLKGGSRVTGASVYAEVLADSTYKAIVDALLEKAAGTSKVAITA